jgi:multicomponent K+:H+ antiporter subunit D
MTDRTRTRIAAFADDAPLQDVTYGGFGMEDPPDPRELEEEVGVAIPAAMAFLGLAFVCCVLLVSGLPPLSGFVAKFALLSAALGTAPVSELSPETWVLFATLLATGLAGVIALTRIGMRLFWSSTGRTTPRLRIIEAGPVAFLVLLCIALTASAAPVMVFLESTAKALRTPHTYVRAVLSEPTFQAPTEELAR